MSLLKKVFSHLSSYVSQMRSSPPPLYTLYVKFETYKDNPFNIWLNSILCNLGEKIYFASGKLVARAKWG